MLLIEAQGDAGGGDSGGGAGGDGGESGGGGADGGLAGMPLISVGSMTAEVQPRVSKDAVSTPFLM